MTLRTGHVRRPRTGAWRAATALVAGLVILTVGRNDALLAAGALSLAIAVLLGAYAYRHRYQAHGGSVQCGI
ncbi:hypothetical protein GT755_00250 [Herbidospora sp. NEAU-GS84]|uniref:Uncharacterized protein n=1 Tax=Herbidospora solisilvae TaxID=2696284 RepID=A0A7C9MXA1_9ACTN|nr:hypothetical protein [Herbidospora solisilvae]NAS20110.1 hypothetical protein [Herbidospora solisilvae]